MGRPFAALADAVLTMCAQAVGPAADADPVFACEALGHWLDRSISDNGDRTDVVNSLRALVLDLHWEWPLSEGDALDLLTQARGVLI